MGSIAYVRVFPGKDGEWYYEPTGENHETLSVSEGYTRKDDAIGAVADAYPDVEIKVGVKNDDGTFEAS